MSHTYTPRRAGSRWLEGAPEYVLDCFDHPTFADRYTVLFGRALAETDARGNVTHIAYLGMSGAPTHPQGVSMWGEMKAHEMVSYRYRNGHKRVRWVDLPEHIRQHVIARAA